MQQGILAGVNLLYGSERTLPQQCAQLAPSDGVGSEIKKPRHGPVILGLIRRVDRMRRMDLGDFAGGDSSHSDDAYLVDVDEYAGVQRDACELVLVAGLASSEHDLTANPVVVLACAVIGDGVGVDEEKAHVGEGDLRGCRTAYLSRVAPVASTRPQRVR
jgi:hypothetical protein